jgi:prophage maintenance system killer protein
METFVIKNGLRLSAPITDKYLTFLALAEGSLPEHELAQWLRERTITS